MERWRDVVGYVGFYEVSNRGRVRGVDRIVRHSWTGTRRIPGAIKTPVSMNQYGHLGVILYRHGRYSNRYIHHLVLEAWVGPRPKGLLALHGPAGHLDNSVNNVYYGTYERNNGIDKERDGTGSVVAVRRSDGVEFPSMTLAADESGCTQPNISSVCNGRRKKAGGFGWEYV
jgi:hypothetical protein